jgi:hydroxymethylglutaryl-CoA synthase
MSIDAVSGCHTEDIMDFWRPNYRKTPLVDGTFSAIKYLQAMKHCWTNYQNNGGKSFHSFAAFCYHLPFTKMGDKAHHHLSKMNGQKPDSAKIEAGKIYNEEIGNCYSASLYLSLASMLDNTKGDLSGQSIGLFSYGSGAVGEFFAGEIVDGYKDFLFSEAHQNMVNHRDYIDYETYLKLWNAPDPMDGETHIITQSHNKNRHFALSKIEGHKRIYDVIESEMAIKESDKSSVAA